MDGLNDIIEQWIHALDQYDQTQLYSKPAQNSWSMGQLYQHLIADTGFYIEQIQLCLRTNDHATEKATPFAVSLFLNNGFPDQLIEGAASHAFIPQPADKDQLINDLLRLRDELRVLKGPIFSSICTGKTKHPGLGYFSAAEWYQFTEIHFRHHLKQKKRLDVFLETEKE